MDRAWLANAVATPPAAPTNPSIGYPVSGNPATGTQATKAGPYWAYMITEEMRNVILAAGLTPDHANLLQLRDAILALIGATVPDAFVYRGVIDCAGAPNYPAADAGHTYRVSVTGQIGGSTGPNVQVGDILICVTDNSVAGTHAVVGANWTIIQANIDGAVVGPVAATDSDFAQFDGATGKVIKGGLSLDTDTAMAANANTRVPSQAAVRAYVASNNALDPEAKFVFVEDFSSQPDPGTPRFGSSYWNVYAGSLSMAGGASGIARFYDDGTNNEAALNDLEQGIFAASRNPVLKVGIANYGNDGGIRRFGFGTDTLDNVPHTIQIRWTPNANLVLAVRSGGAETTLDSGVAMTTGVFRKVRVVVTGTTSVQLFVDGVARGMIVTNIPVSAMRLRTLLSGSAAGNGMDIDYIQIIQDR